MQGLATIDFALLDCVTGGNELADSATPDLSDATASEATTTDAAAAEPRVPVRFRPFVCTAASGVNLYRGQPWSNAIWDWAKCMGTGRMPRAYRGSRN